MAQQRWRAATIAAVLAAAGPAAADALDYQAPEGCPPEPAFRALLRRELPASALDDRGGARFGATVEADGAQWTAVLTVERDGRGAVVARLEDASCEAAVARLAAATVLAVRGAPAPEPARPTPVSPDRVRALRLGIAGGWGDNAISDGAVVDLDLTYGDDARLGGWLRGSASATSAGATARATANDASLGVQGCFQRRMLEICLRAGAGMLSLRRTSTFIEPRSSRAYLDVAGRLGVLVELRRRVALRVAVEGGVVSHHQRDEATGIDPAVSRLRGTVGVVLLR